MDIPILYEDEAFLVVNKSAGVVVDRSETGREGTVQDWAGKKLKIQSSSASPSEATSDRGKAGRAKFKVTGKNVELQEFLSRSGIVHRLDKETSGCLIIAKTPAAFTNLQQQFKNRTVEKEYLALVHGRVEPKKGTIRVPLKRSRFDRQKMAVRPGGRGAETRYELSSKFKVQSSKFSLLKLFPKTGRTHQIRVHLKYLGHPVVGDEKYAGAKRAQKDRRWCPRLFLHAEKISFTHPQTLKRLSVEAKLPPDLKEALASSPCGRVPSLTGHARPH